MFDLDRWREIFQSINKNRLRSVLSGFTVAFAILLFTLLFGVVNGLQNTFKDAFVDDAANSMFIFARTTSKPYKGLKKGRRIQLKNSEYSYLNKEYENKIQFATKRIYKNGFNISYRDKQDNYNIRAVNPDHQFLEKTIMEEGRYINELDIVQGSKVIVIGRLVKKDLFGERPAIGKYLNVNNIAYKVVGVFSDDGGDNEERLSYIPVTTAQRMVNNDYVDQINLGYNPNLSLDEAIAFGNKIERDLKKQLQIHPDDQNALFVRNMAEANKGVGIFMLALYAIVLLVGSGTLIAGIIGISNIMIFVIKERTKEFGIRKALGAKPASIVAMVLQESVLITTIAGYAGLTLGSYILDAIGDTLEDYFIKDPGVSTGLVIGALFILVVSGLIAGLVPARRAARIKPIVALRAD